jgi:DNA-binding transcriptional LysR family regulator
MAALSLDDLAVFVRVVERGGFASAARDLGTPTSTVSRAIERLEARAGVRLLHRSTRQVRPTGDGQELYVAIAPAVSNLRATAQTLEPTSKLPSGKLPEINAAEDAAGGRLRRVLPEYSSSGASLFVIYPSKRQIPPRVAAFRDFVGDYFRAWSSD